MSVPQTQQICEQIAEDLATISKLRSKLFSPHPCTCACTSVNNHSIFHLSEQGTKYPGQDNNAAILSNPRPLFGCYGQDTKPSNLHPCVGPPCPLCGSCGKDTTSLGQPAASEVRWGLFAFQYHSSGSSAFPDFAKQVADQKSRGRTSEHAGPVTPKEEKDATLAARLEVSRARSPYAEEARDDAMPYVKLNE